MHIYHDGRSAGRHLSLPVMPHPYPRGPSSQLTPPFQNSLPVRPLCPSVRNVSGECNNVTVFKPCPMILTPQITSKSYQMKSWNEYSITCHRWIEYRWNQLVIDDWDPLSFHLLLIHLPWNLRWNMSQNYSGCWSTIIWGSSFITSHSNHWTRRRCHPLLNHSHTPVRWLRHSLHLMMGSQFYWITSISFVVILVTTSIQ